MEKRSGKPNYRVAFTLILISLLILSLYAAYTIFVMHLMQADTAVYLEKNSTAAVEYVETRIQKDLSDMKLLAKTCANIPSWEEQLEHLRLLKDQASTSSFALVTPDGTVHTLDGRTLPRPQDPILRRALSGQSLVTISNAFSKRETEEVVCAVPIQTQGGAVSGALLQWGTQPLLDRWLPAAYSEHVGLALSNGDLLQANDDVFQRGSNLFSELTGRIRPNGPDSLAELSHALKEGRAGLFYFHVDHREMALSYAPLSVDGWFLLTHFPLHSVNQSLSLALYLGLLLDALLCFVFTGFLLYFRRAQHRHMSALEHCLFTDPVTGGNTQARFSIQCTQTIRAAPSGTYAILAADIQAFGLVNRTFGEHVGNRVLRYFYHTLSAQLQPGEQVARLTQDQFALLLLQAPEHAMRERLEQLVQVFNSFNKGSSTPYYLPLTIGVCPVEDNQLLIDDLLDRANLARKKAKQTAGDQLCTCMWYCPEDREEILVGQRIYNRMDRALERGEFKIYFQPKISLTNQRIVGAEALVRWYDEERGLIAPDGFIPLFEKNGFINRLDRYMFEQSCIYLRKWLDMGLTPVPISVNLSRANLVPDVLTWYKEVQMRYRLPNGLLEFELTETMVGENPAFFSELITEMHRLGFPCSMDDFGSGYSTLHMLQKVPVDTLKLDKSLFDGLLIPEEQERCQQVVECILDLAHRLGLKTVAEGIDSQAQLAFLAKHPCDMIQGYYFSCPIPAEEFCSQFLTPPFSAEQTNA